MNARLTELDSLRGLAALGVVTLHYSAHFKAAPFSEFLAPFYQQGYRLVDFFFILSGFVLARTYWTVARSSNLFRSVLDRIARLYPLHFVTLLAVAGGQWFLLILGEPQYMSKWNDGYHFALNLALSNYIGLQHGYSFNVPSWSISTEFFVNIVFLLIILLPRRIALTTICVVTLASVTVLRDAVDALLLRTVFGFFMGVLLYVVVAPLAIRLRKSVWDMAFVASVVLYAITAASPLYAGDLRSFIASSLLFYLIIVSAQASHLAKSALQWRALVFIGTISYSIYLVHFPIQLGFRIIETWFAVPYQHPAFFVAFFLLVIGCSALTYKFIELPGKMWMKSMAMPLSFRTS